ncbi:MAG: molybdenum cofactor carrier protein [Verrucomicrobiales bacterium]
MFPRLPIIGVIGSGSDPQVARAGIIGRLLAEEGVHLLTGGGGGSMAEVARAFVSVGPQRLGRSIGILPGSVEDGAALAPDGYPNPWIEIPIPTHLPLSGITGTSTLSRNHINVLACKAIIALGGSAGTCSEVRLARSYRKPILAFLPDWRLIEGLDFPIATTEDEGTLRAFVRRWGK